MSRLKNKEDNSLNQVLALEVFFVCVSLYFSTHFWVRFFDENASYFGIRYIERLFRSCSTLVTAHPSRASKHFLVFIYYTSDTNIHLPSQQ